MPKVLIKKRYNYGNVKHFLSLTGLMLVMVVGFFSLARLIYAAPITGIGPISGTTQEGQTLTAGAITPASETATTTYQWQDSYSPNGITVDGVSGVFLNIPGVTSRTYVLTLVDLGKYIRVIARGNTGGVVTSATTTIVTSGTPSSGPITSFGPIIGTAQVGQTLIAGGVTPIRTPVTYRWQFGNSSNGTFTNIGVTSRTYILNSTKVGKYIRVIARDSTGEELNATTTTAVIVANLPPGGPLGTCVVDAPIPGLGSGPFTNTQSDCVSPPINGRWTVNSTSPPPAPTDTTYTPLAPLPGLGTPGCVDSKGKPCINTAGDNAFGNYLNIMIRLIIGLVAVGAVVMIFIGGIEYMTSEIISNKEHGKERIRNALLGLLIALSAYLLLKTINPDLLKTDINIANVDIIIETEVENYDTLESDFAGSDMPPGTAVSLCPEGIYPLTVSGGSSTGDPGYVNICRRISFPRFLF